LWRATGEAEEEKYGQSPAPAKHNVLQINDMSRIAQTMHAWKQRRVAEHVRGGVRKGTLSLLPGSGELQL
jgi:hypothetical protein